MTKSRLEAFSDGVLAIIITIMVLELKVPHDADPAVLLKLAPVFLSYVLSFVFVGIYWNNHHHTFHAIKHISGGVLWANLHLLFWLSLIPFVTGWMGENHFSKWTVFAYGVVMLASAIAYAILLRVLIAVNGADSPIAKAVGADWKGKASLGIYALGLLLVFAHPLAAIACYVAVAIMWLVPDKRMERALSHER